MSLFARNHPLASSAFSPSPSSFQRELSPFINLFNSTFHELDRLASSHFPAAAAGEGAGSHQLQAWAPKFDVRESADAYTLEGELPGIDGKDLAIDFVDEHTLTVKGRTESSREEGTRPSSTRQLKGGVGEQQAVGGPDHSAARSAEAAGASGGTSAAGATTAGAENWEVATTTTSSEVAKPAQQHTYWISERSVGSFQRSFNFPSRVDHENVKASLKNGILSIVVPKLAEKAVSRRIAIESE